MTVEEFRAEFFQDVLIAADGEGSYVSEAFFSLFSSFLVEAGELDSADLAFYEARGMRIDGYGGDPLESGTLTLIVVEADLTPDMGTLTKTDMDTAFKRAKTFLTQSLKADFRSDLDPANPGFGVADLIASRWSNIQKVRLLLLTDRRLSTRIDGKAADEINGIPVVHSVWDMGALADLVLAGRGGGEVTIDLAEFGGPLSALPAHAEGEDVETYLLVVQGTQLGRIYDRWGPRLLEQNVRVFLQARGKVNKGIRATLQNSPEMFLAFNNGISATAEAVEIERTSHGLDIVKFTNLQIVNGGQTTASVHLAMRQGVDLSRVFVQMKLSVVPRETALDVVPKISEFANTQNRVNAADFFANHPYHVRIEGMSRRIFAPSPDGAFKKTKWFYERARGQYQDDRLKLSPAQRKGFDLEFPKAQLFAKTDLAKFQMTWLGHPHIVSRGSQKNFVAFAQMIGKAWEADNERFNELYYRDAIATAILFREAERLVPRQSWYGGGYRANIVTYAIAKVAHELKSHGLRLDLGDIWSRQGIDEHTSAALEVAAEKVNEVLTSPPASHRNVTEWAKQDACWDRVKRAEVPWPESFLKSARDLEIHINQTRDASAVQRIDSGIELQAAVVNAGGPFWREALDWGRAQRGLLTAKDVDILSICASIPQKLPTEGQCRVAQQALSKLQAEGFSGKL